MNIAQCCRQLILAEFDNAWASTLDADWRAALSKVQEATVVGPTSTVRVAGRLKMRVPAASISTIQVRVHKQLPIASGVMILEPMVKSLPRIWC